MRLLIPVKIAFKCFHCILSKERWFRPAPEIKHCRKLKRLLLNSWKIIFSYILYNNFDVVQKLFPLLSVKFLKLSVKCAWNKCMYIHNIIIYMIEFPLYKKIIHEPFNLFAVSKLLHKIIDDLLLFICKFKRIINKKCREVIIRKSRSLAMFNQICKFFQIKSPIHSKLWILFNTLLLKLKLNHSQGLLHLFWYIEFSLKISAYLPRIESLGKCLESWYINSKTLKKIERIVSYTYS